VCQLHHADTDCLALLFGIFSTRFFRVRFRLEWSGQRSELTFDVGVEKPAITCFGHLKFIARFAIGGVNQRKSICFKSRYGTQHLYFVCKYARACSGVLNSPVHSNGSPLPISQTTIGPRRLEPRYEYALRELLQRRRRMPGLFPAASRRPTTTFSESSQHFKTSRSRQSETGTGSS
jgi:hypothetical protein